MHAVITEALPKPALQFAELSVFQRVLLITDGTLTHILEAYVGEKIRVLKLSETTRPVWSEIADLDLRPGSDVIERKILLQGSVSHRNWLYAESFIVPERLDPIFQEQLTNSRQPIGKLWTEHKVETFKEIITTYQEPAGHLSDAFAIHPHALLLCRTYRVLSNRQPVMLITEKFPASYYTHAFERGV
ncbi:MAG: DUF98 domain-containing protein [Chloroflexaceae bacterium]|nr:DUF98 domain-containing protein [Chloroflexaceae bacterium]